MKDRQDDYAMALDSEINAVRETVCGDATSLRMHDCVELWVLGCKNDAPFDFSYELRAQIGALALIPRGGLHEFRQRRDGS